MATIPIFHPVVPFLGQIPGGLRPSLMIRLKGRINGPNGRCSIDFLNSPALNSNQDILFHIGIRPREGIIARNHFQNGSWGLEEQYGPCLVKSNQPFEIVILAEVQHYKLAVNGHHLGVFHHRLPLHLAQYLHVRGDTISDVTIDHILLEQDMRSAPGQTVISQVYATPSCPPLLVHQPHHHHAPPSYFSHQPTHSTFTSIGAPTINSQPRVIIIQQRRRRHPFRF